MIYRLVEQRQGIEIFASRGEDHDHAVQRVGRAVAVARARATGAASQSCSKSVHAAFGAISSRAARVAAP